MAAPVAPLFSLAETPAVEVPFTGRVVFGARRIESGKGKSIRCSNVPMPDRLRLDDADARCGTGGHRARKAASLHLEEARVAAERRVQMLKRAMVSLACVAARGTCPLYHLPRLG